MQKCQILKCDQNPSSFTKNFATAVLCMNFLVLVSLLFSVPISVYPVNVFYGYFYISVLVWVRSFFHRTTKWLRLAGTPGDLWCHPCSDRNTQSRLPRTMSKRLLKISKEGDSTTSLFFLCYFFLC